MMKDSTKSTSSEAIITQSNSPLCDLPTEILRDILALLPIGDAVSFCTLSRSYEKLCKSMPFLSFIQDDHRPRGNSSDSEYAFPRFIYRVCTLHNPNHPILRFQIQTGFHLYDDFQLLQDSIEIALKCGVREMFIDLYTSLYYELPATIFTSQSLEQLHLECDSKAPLQLPELVSPPLLKVLYLTSINLPDLASVQQLCSCPALEEPEFKLCCWSWRRSDIGSVDTIPVSPNLKRLSMIFNCVLPPVRFVQCESLKELYYIGVLTHKLDIFGAKNLERVAK